MELVFGGAIFAAGFVALCRTVLKQLDKDHRIFGIMLAIFFVYSCAAGGILFVAYIMGETGLLLYFLFIIYSIAEAVTLIKACRDISGRVEAKHVWLFLLYFAAILTVTIFSREERGERILQTDVTLPIKYAMEGKSMAGVYHMILNMLMFVPFGYLLAQIHPRRLGTVFITAGLGCMLSTVIETCQFAFHLGNCEVGDILSNTIGSMVGLYVYRWMRNRE